MSSRTVATSVGTESDKNSAEKAQDVATLAQGAGFTLVGGFAGRGIHIFTQILLARVLGPQLFGVYAIAWTILRLFGVLASLGFHNGVIHFGAVTSLNSLSETRALIWRTLLLTLTTSCTIMIMVYLLAPWLALSVFDKPNLLVPIRLFAIAFPLAASLQVSAAATRITKQTQYGVFAENLIQPLTNLIIVLVLIWFGLGLVGAVLAAVVSYGFACLTALIFLSRLFPKASAEYLVAARASVHIPSHQIIFFSAPTAMSGLFLMLTIWADRLLVGYYLTASDVGIYQASSQTAMLFAIILMGFNLIFTPMIADLYHSGQRDRLQELFRVSTKWGLYLCLPFFLVILFKYSIVMGVIFGPAYQAGGVPMMILASGQLVNAATGAVGSLLIMTGHQKKWLLLSVLMFGVNLLLNVILIPRLGIVGAALGTSIAVASLFLWGLWSVAHLLKFMPYDRRYLKAIIAVGVTIAALIFTQEMLTLDNSLMQLIVFLTLSFVVFFIIIICLKLDDEDLQVLHALGSRFTVTKEF